MHTPARAAVTPASTADLRVHVDSDPRGGWQVTATAGNRVVASRHCDDWHRVERACRSFAVIRPEAGAVSVQ